MPVKALSVVFRAKFRDILRREGLLNLVDPEVWGRDWVVHSQAAGEGRESLRYLAPYVFPVAIGSSPATMGRLLSPTAAWDRTGLGR